MFAKLSEIEEGEDERKSFQEFIGALFELDLSLTVDKGIAERVCNLLRRFAKPEFTVIAEDDFYGYLLNPRSEDSWAPEDYEFHFRVFERNIAYIRRSLSERRDETLLAGVDNLNCWLKNAEHLYGILRSNSFRAISLEQRVESLEEGADASKREYITILGIFAAIVVAFTAGVSFSGSALQNVGSASPYKLGLVLIPMAWFLLDLVGLLIVFLFAMVHKAKQRAFYVMLTTGNLLFLVLLVLDISFGQGL